MSRFKNYSELTKKFDWEKTKGVLIDIDDTLYNYQICHDYALFSCFKYIKLKIKLKVTKINFFNAYLAERKIIAKKHKNSGLCRSRYLAFLNYLDSIGTKNNYIEALNLEDIYWKKFFSKMKPHNGLKQFLHKCKKNSIKVCAITDMQIRFQIKKISKLNLTKYINSIVTSEEAECEKPNLKIFKLANKKLNLKKYELIMIGDNYKKDILGAKKFGIKYFQLIYDKF
jgi:HAD superfamily hydrolase (TIGR01549 family)